MSQGKFFEENWLGKSEIRTEFFKKDLNYWLLQEVLPIHGTRRCAVSLQPLIPQPAICETKPLIFDKLLPVHHLASRNKT